MGTKRELRIGGIVTPILISCGVELNSKPNAPRWVDIEHLKRSRFVNTSSANDVYLYQFTHPEAG